MLVFHHASLGPTDIGLAASHDGGDRLDEVPEDEEGGLEIQDDLLVDCDRQFSFQRQSLNPLLAGRVLLPGAAGPEWSTSAMRT